MHLSAMRKLGAQRTQLENSELMVLGHMPEESSVAPPGTIVIAAATSADHGQLEMP